MLKVAILGCGKIADLHVMQIHRISEAKVVAVCDRELLMARQLADRFRIEKFYDNLEELLLREKPDVVHVTTSPESHLTLAQRCLLAGSHVYVEKPFTITLKEAIQLLQIAESCDKTVTVGHNVQFTRPAMEMRKLVADGFLGGPPNHMESYFGYELGDGSYVRALLSDKDHWVRQLPGGLLQNIISHGIAKIAEFLPGDDPEVIACGFVSPRLLNAGEKELVDELRVVLADRENGVTAYFTFSTQARPALHQFRLYGPTNGLLIDDDQSLLLRLRGERYKSYLENFIPPITFARQYVGGLAANMYQFVTQELHTEGGMKNLIAAFYSSIVSGTSPPIPYREILLTTKIMERIFDQLSRLPPKRDDGS